MGTSQDGCDPKQMPKTAAPASSHVAVNIATRPQFTCYVEATSRDFHPGYWQNKSFRVLSTAAWGAEIYPTSTTRLRLPVECHATRQRQSVVCVMTRHSYRGPCGHGSLNWHNVCTYFKHRFIMIRVILVPRVVLQYTNVPYFV